MSPSVIKVIGTPEAVQYKLFEDPVRAEKVKCLCAAIGEISQKYGHTLHLAGFHAIETQGSGKGGNRRI